MFTQAKHVQIQVNVWEDMLIAEAEVLGSATVEQQVQEDSTP